MAVTDLATQNAVFQATYLAVALGAPTVGWILLIVGLKQRSRSRPQSHLKPQARSKPPAKGGSSGTTLIAIGAVLLALGVLAIVVRLAIR